MFSGRGSLIIVLPIYISLFSCEGSNNEPVSETAKYTVKNEIIDSIEADFKNLERKNQLPLPDQSDTLPGFDLNQDGVRDDIERLIDMQPVRKISSKFSLFSTFFR
jgi:hypothetical protein